MSEINVNTIDKATGSTLTVGASGTTVNIAGTAGTGFPGSSPNVSNATGTLPIANGGTGAATFAAAGLANTPTFSARSTSHQTGLTNGGWTKIQFDTAIFNVGSNYDTTNDKFVAPSNGKYLFSSSLKIQSAGGGATLEGAGCRITINGSTMGDNVAFIANGSLSVLYAMNTMILDLTATQYVEIYAYYQDSGGGTGSARLYDTMFHGCKLIT